VAEAAENRQGEIDLARAAALSDGIFAVAMTLLIVALPLPKSTAELGGVPLGEHLLTLLPAFRAIAIGFFVAAVFWRAHHGFFRCLAKGDGTLMWLNFLLLFAVAATPLSSSLLGSFHSEAVTVALYAANVAVISASLFLMWLHVNRKRALLNADVGSRRIPRGLWGASLRRPGLPRLDRGGAILGRAGAVDVTPDHPGDVGRPARASVIWLRAAAALALVALAAAPAEALTCPVSHPRVQLSVDVAAPVIDNTLPQPALQRLAGASHHGGRTQGLYRGGIRTRWQTRIGGRQLAGLACRWIDEVTITMTAAARTIYVARERRPGTCPYDSVLKHERRHQAADDAVIAEFAPRLKRRVARAIAALPPPAPLPPGDAAAVERRLTAAVERAVHDELRALEAARRARQAAIDTPGEYRRVGAACG